MSTPNGQPQPEPTNVRILHWRRLKGPIDELADAAADVEDWPYLLAWAIGGGVIAVTICRLVLTFTVNARAGIAIAGVSTVLALAVVCLIGLAWASWKIRLTTTVAVLGVGLLFSLVAIGICVEAFASITVLLWRHDLISGVPGVDPSLWRTERYYLWHLVDSIPFLDIPQGVQWREPKPFSDIYGGGILLAYKILLIAPLASIGIGAYQLFATHVVEKEAKERDLARRKVVPSFIYSDSDYAYRVKFPWLAELWRWTGTALFLAFPVLVGLLMPLAFEPGAGLDAWVAHLLSESGFSFLRTTPQWVIAGLLVLMAMSMVDEVATTLVAVRRGRELIEIVLWYISTIGFVLVAAAAVNLSLLHSGLASTSPEMPPDKQVHATVAAYAMYFTETLPGPDIPGTLNWTLQYTLTDRWSTILILLGQGVMVSLLIATVTRALLSVQHYAQPAVVAALKSAEEFSEKFLIARLAIDQAITGNQPNGRAKYGLGSVPGQAAERVVAQLDSVEALFGSSEVTELADAAAGALHRLSRHWDEESDYTQEEEQAFTAYCEAASQALAAASQRIRNAATPRPSSDD
ncbi:hypothetical protein OG426_43255 [Streptomyces canus]|uniref:hypothetical protein n=1 Tax=Streptomyces canus TaxID=58343 RepID=UPI00386FFDDB|nr:hypothetical protein OG426_43255 [Streptomyces canus]